MVYVPDVIIHQKLIIIIVNFIKINDIIVRTPTCSGRENPCFAISKLIF